MHLKQAQELLIMFGAAIAVMLVIGGFTYQFLEEPPVREQHSSPFPPLKGFMQEVRAVTEDYTSPTLMWPQKIAIEDEIGPNPVYRFKQRDEIEKTKR